MDEFFGSIFHAYSIEDTTESKSFQTYRKIMYRIKFYFISLEL